MDIPFADILAMVRATQDPVAALDALRVIGEARLDSPVWRAIKTPDTEADVHAASLWLRETLTPYQPTGAYQGLDTLNERKGAGKNIEIGMSKTHARAATPCTLCDR